MTTFFDYKNKLHIVIFSPFRGFDAVEVGARTVVNAERAFYFPRSNYNGG